MLFVYSQQDDLISNDYVQYQNDFQDHNEVVLLIEYLIFFHRFTLGLMFSISMHGFHSLWPVLCSADRYVVASDQIYIALETEERTNKKNSQIEQLILQGSFFLPVRV